jgi:hypothetical protein
LHPGDGPAIRAKRLDGFQPSFFGEDSLTLAAFMNKLGAQNADFTVAETYDRDAGCYEAALLHPTASTNLNAASVCSGRGNGPFYYDGNPIAEKSRALITRFTVSLFNEVDS